MYIVCKGCGKKFMAYNMVRKYHNNECMKNYWKIRKRKKGKK
jgi:hypothetical protein